MRISKILINRLADAENTIERKEERTLALKDYFNSFNPELFNKNEWDYVKKVLQEEQTKKIMKWTFEEIENDFSKGDELIYSDFGEILEIVENKNRLAEIFPESFLYIKNLNLSCDRLDNFTDYIKWYLKGHTKKSIQEFYTDYFY